VNEPLIGEPPIAGDAERRRSSASAVVAAGLIAAALALALGVYGSVHDPTGRDLPTAWFDSTRSLKSWLATTAIALMILQALIGLRINPARTSLSPPRPRLVEVHRLVGTVAFALTLPVVFHCLWSLGFQTSSTRVLIHSLAGTAAYGAYAAKILLVRRPDSPRWAIPAAGAFVLVIFVVAWWSSAMWFFTTATGLK